jgi:muramidase (phage lysozyme)
MPEQSPRFPDLFLLALVPLCATGCVGNLVGDESNAADPLSAPAHYIVASDDTFLKRTNAQSTTLAWGSEKCRIFAGDRIASTAAPVIVGDHFLIETASSIPGCEFTRGYVWTGHVSDASSSTTGDDGAAGGCHAAITSRQCALLATVAYAEGTNSRYDIIFSFATFSSYADHPRRVMCSSGYCSDAAGRYQFLSTTWDGAARTLGLPDFSPASQDRAALWLMRNRGVTNIDAIDTYGEFQTAMYRLNREWASLPGSPYGQPTHSTSTLWAKYRGFAGL